MARERIVSLRLSSDLRSPEPEQRSKTDEADSVHHVQLTVLDPAGELEELVKADTEEEATAVSHYRPASRASRDHKHHALYEKVLVEDDEDGTGHDHLAMGPFMDQVSQLSIQIDLLQAQLDTPRDGFNRVLLLERIEHEHLAQLMLLHADRAPPPPDSAASSHSLWQTERSMRSGQVSGLRLRLNEVVVKLRQLADEEKDRLRKEVEAEWRERLDTDSEDGVDGLLKLDATHASRRLSRVVRGSMQYPLARQAALAIEVQLERLRQLDAELAYSDRLMRWLSMAYLDTHDPTGKGHFVSLDINLSTASISLESENPGEDAGGKTEQDGKQKSSLLSTVNRKCRLGGVPLIGLAVLMVIIAGIGATVYFFFIRRN